MGLILNKDTEMYKDFFHYNISFNGNNSFVGVTKYEVGEMITWFLNYDNSNFEIEINKIAEMTKRLWNITGEYNDCANLLLDMQNVLNQLNNEMKEMPMVHLSDADEFLLSYVIANPVLISPEESEQEFEEAREQNLPLNQVSFIKGTINIVQDYLKLADDIQYIRSVYSDLLDHYIHMQKAMPDAEWITKTIHSYLVDNEKENRDHLVFESAEGVTLSQKLISFMEVVEGEGRFEEKILLCQSIRCNRLRDIIYLEFFQALQVGNIPKKCKNCGLYFVIERGHYLEYCNRPAPGKDDKTCNQIGANETFKEKTQNNPVWKSYTKFYKRYCARRKNGKLTNEQVTKWVTRATKLRDKALIELEEIEILAENLEELEENKQRVVDKYLIDIDIDKKKKALDE